ncbi:MAG: hypothetical protein ABIP48_29215 [Planctomycetota bacterium]
METVQSERDSYLDQLAAFESLRDVAEDAPERLLEQILYYSSSAANDHDRRLYAFLMIGHFRYADTTIVRAVMPYIYTNHLELNGVVRDLLTGIEKWVKSTPANYACYEPVIRGSKDDPPTNLVRYMYERSPGSAVLSMMYVYLQDRDARKPILWAEHVVSDVLWKHRHRFLDKNEVPEEAAAELEKLSKHEAWWARLYVAEIFRRHPQFRRPEVVERLAADEHPLVRRAMGFANPQPDGASDTQNRPQD